MTNKTTLTLKTTHVFERGKYENEDEDEYITRTKENSKERMRGRERLYLIGTEAHFKKKK